MGYDETLFTVLRSGNEIDLRDPDPAAVSLDDVIGNLAKITRYVGSEQTVAQHCFYVAEHLREQGASKQIQLHGLLHDAQEAYIGDIPRPTKNLDPDFEAILDTYEDAVLDAIYEALDLEQPSSAIEDQVKAADTEVALIELNVLGKEGILRKTVDRFPGWTDNDVDDLLQSTDWWNKRDWRQDGQQSGSLFRERYEMLRTAIDHGA